MKVIAVGDVVRFGDRDIEAEVIKIEHGWILARTADPHIPYGYIITRQ